MDISKEMRAYEAQINIKLLNDIMQFVIGTVPSAQIFAVREKCILLKHYSGKDTFQQEYGFLYLGELLERYEERFGPSDADFRAIALALGYLKDVVTDDMFVGAQKINFLRQLERRARNDDLYLTGALCLLNEGQRNAASPYQQVMERQYNKLEELIFALSIAPDFEEAFRQLKPQLLELLTTKRNMPILGNTGILDWLIVQLQPLLKTVRAKDMALFRALCALPTSFVRPGSKPHDLLLASGYSSLEISYANMMTVQYQEAANVLRRKSIVTEKIAVELFQTVLGNRDTLPDSIYLQLTQLFHAYRAFDIKCYGAESLLVAMGECPPIQDVQTFAWFSKLASPDNPAFSAFDVMDARWDDLAVKMEPDGYLALFDLQLNDDMDADEIKRHIARYEMISGKDYLQPYWDTHESRRFCLLVEKGVINLWDAFLASLDNDKNVVKPKMISRINCYLRGLPTVQAFQFLDCFLLEHGFDDWDKYFRDLDWFIDSLAERRRSHHNGYSEVIQLRQAPEYMDAAMRRSRLYWLEQYYFQKKPDQYLKFMVAILEDEENAAVLPEEKLKALFKLLIAEPALVQDAAHKLKDRFMTAEEKEEEQARINAARQREEEKKQQAFAEATLAKYKDATDGTVCSISKALEEQAKYRKDVAKVLYPVALQEILEILVESDYTLDSKSIYKLLEIFATLVKFSVLRFSEAQKHIANIKEDPEHENLDIPTC